MVDCGMEFPEFVFDVDSESKRLQKLLDRYSWAIDALNKLPVKKAAVLIAIFQFKGRPHVILTERSRGLRTHAGDVALPGGRVDSTDEGIVDAALREAEEEIGLKRECVDIVGTSIPLYSTVAKVIVYPVIGFIRNIASVTLTINVEEVESVFAVPLSAFVFSKDFVIFGKLRYPQVIWNCGKYCDCEHIVEGSPSCLQTLFCNNRTYRVWGITCFMLYMYSSVVFRKAAADVSFGNDGTMDISKLIKNMIKTYQSKL